jgi:hypothetical protein
MRHEMGTRLNTIIGVTEVLEGTKSHEGIAFEFHPCVFEGFAQAGPES